MKSMKRFLGVAAGLALVFSVTARAQAEEVFVFAAASLTNALNEIGEQFAARTGHSMKPSYAASSALAKQVEQGAPAQVFLSADLKWMDYLADKKLINADSRANLLGNTLVLVTASDSKQGKVEITPRTDIAALLGDGRLATGDPDHVPVGIYFKQAAEKMGQWGVIQNRLARAESVRAALALVERGEAPLGVVYATDAQASKKIKVVGVFPDTLHEQITYPVALVAGKETAGAKAFLDYVKGQEAKGVFAKHGFKLN